MSTFYRVILSAAGAAALAVVAAAPGLAQSNFYEGKQVRIIMAGSTGSNYDNYARLASRHLGKHIPGNPTITVQAMTGASGIIAANNVYNVAPKDGTVILAAHSSMALAQMTGTPNIEFDARKFAWVGRLASGGYDVHYTWHTSNATKFQDLLDREVILGGTGPTSNSVILPTAVNKLLGGKIKVLTGYKGTSDTALAIERGEVQMAMMSWDLLRNQRAEWLRDKKINLLVQYNTDRHPEIANVPTIFEVSKTEEQKQIWSLILQPVVIGYSIGVAPDVPADRLAILRKAYEAMVKDQEFLDDAKKVNLPIEPMSGEGLGKAVAEMFKADASAVETAKTLMSGK
jgi:tripartite-type tricarboxylate transporter receptor subunit TctC